MNLPSLFPRRRLLLFGLLAALVPLAVLLGFQFVWLSRLEETTKIAYEAALHYYVEAVGSRVEYKFRYVAERTLNLPADLIAEHQLGSIAAHWSQESSPAVSRLFLVDYTRDAFGNYYVYDPERSSLVTALGSDETLAMIVACSPWAVPSGRGRTAQLGLVADDRNPDYRFVLNPITNDAGIVIGMAGMILSEPFVRKELLPETIDDTLSHFFSEASSHFQVLVRDDDHRIVYAMGEGADEIVAATGAAAVGDEATVEANAAVARFPFVFTDWTIELRGRGRSPEELANASFTSNMTLAALLAALLLAGIVLSLRAASRAVRLSEMKSDFVSNVSHELRTPVASIRVFGELLSHGRADSPEKVRRYGEHIETESRRLTRLIDNILDFSRMESGKKEYHFEEARLEPLVEGAVEATRVRLSEAGFDIRYESPPEALPSLSLDSDAIGQVLHNLIDNAVKYSGDARRIELRVFRENGSAVFTVRDEGVGIPEDEQQRIFERFHRVQTSLVHDVKGSGLGLAIVQHVVRAHGGHVDVASERGRGTTVFVRIPLPNGAAGDDTGCGDAPEEGA